MTSCICVSGIVSLSSEVWRDVTTLLCQSGILSKLAQDPTLIKHWPTHVSSVQYHLQLYKRTAYMVCNCGMSLIRIRHEQNVIRSKQYPVKVDHEDHF